MQCCPRSNSAIGSQTRPVPAPEQRTSKAGKPFVKVTLKAKDGDTAQWWKLVAFSESVQAELMRLVEGDAILKRRSSGIHRRRPYKRHHNPCIQ
jgi:hypothetical protein